MDEREISISFKDLMHKVLLGWKWLILSAVVFAILANCYGIYKDYRSIAKRTTDGEKSKLTLIEQIEAAKKPLSAEEIEDVVCSVEMNNRLRASILSMEEYMENSVLMQIDYKHTPTINMLYYVDLKDETKQCGDDIALAYKDVLINDASYDFLSNQLAVKEEYVRELVQISTESNSLKLTIYGKDEEQCKFIHEYFEKTINKAKNQIAVKFPSYDLRQVTDSFHYTFSEEIYDKQYKMNSNLMLTRTDYLNIKDDLTGDQKTLFTAVLKYSLQNGEETVEESPVEEGQKTETAEMVTANRVSYIHKKLILIGFVGGIFFAALIIAVRYLLKPVIRVKENISVDLGQALLGTVKEDKKSTDYENEIEMICTNIRIGTKKNEFDKIYITGAGAKNEKVVDDIFDALKDECSIEKGACIIDNTDSLGKFSESDAVVFVEKAGVSRTEDVIKEIKLAGQSKVSVLGFVFLQ